MGRKKTTEVLLFWGTLGIAVILTSLFVLSIYGYDLKWFMIMLAFLSATVIELCFYGAFRKRTQTASQALIGATVVVSEALNPSGWVKVRGELWKAESIDNLIPEGAKGIVVDARGAVLIVRKMDED